MAQAASEINQEKYEQAVSTLKPFVDEKNSRGLRMMALLVATGKGAALVVQKAQDMLDEDIPSSLVLRFFCPSLMFKSTLPAKELFATQSIRSLGNSDLAGQRESEATEAGFNLNECWGRKSE